MRLPDWLRDTVVPLSRRVRRMDADQMLMWVDASATDMRQGLAEHVRTGAPSALAEYERGLAVLVAMAEELRRRTPRISA